MHPARRQALFPARFTAQAEGQAGVREAGAALYAQCLQRIDGQLAGQRFVLGGEGPSACDHQLMVYAHWCALDARSLDALPHFAQWLDRMLRVPAVQAALRAVASPLAARITAAVRVSTPSFT